MELTRDSLGSANGVARRFDQLNLIVLEGVARRLF
jgi:hypothetical protein